MTDPLAVPPCPECAGEAVACDGCKQAYADAIEQLRAEQDEYIRRLAAMNEILDKRTADLGEARDLCEIYGEGIGVEAYPWTDELEREQSND